MRRRKKPQKKEREKGKILVIKLLKKNKTKKNCTQYGFSVSYILTKTEILKVSAYQNFGLFLQIPPPLGPQRRSRRWQPTRSGRSRRRG